MAAQKKAVPQIERPPSKVEQGLAAADKPIEDTPLPDMPEAPAPKWIENERERDAAGQTPEERVSIAIEAMVAAGISREVAEATFILADGTEGVDATEVVEAVAELAGEDHGQPLCSCFGASWADVNPRFDSVGCEHGQWHRKPKH